MIRAPLRPTLSGFTAVDAICRCRVGLGLGYKLYEAFFLLAATL